MIENLELTPTEFLVVNRMLYYKGKDDVKLKLGKSYNEKKSEYERLIEPQKYNSDRGWLTDEEIEHIEMNENKINEYNSEMIYSVTKRWQYLENSLHKAKCLIEIHKLKYATKKHPREITEKKIYKLNPKKVHSLFNYFYRKSLSAGNKEIIYYFLESDYWNDNLFKLQLMRWIFFYNYEVKYNKLLKNIHKTKKRSKMIKYKDVNVKWRAAQLYKQKTDKLIMKKSKKIVVPPSYFYSLINNLKDVNRNSPTVSIQAEVGPIEMYKAFLLFELTTCDIPRYQEEYKKQYITLKRKEKSKKYSYFLQEIY